MVILGIDMGWSNSVSCRLEKESGEIRYETLETSRAAFRRQIGQAKADLVVIEAGPMAGWVRDECEQLQQKLLVVNTNDEPWQWSKVKRKTDRKDAFKLCEVGAYSRVQPVHVPTRPVRQWRQLIPYRDTLGAKLVSIKNRVRGLLLQEDLRLLSGAKAWEAQEYARLKALARPLRQCGAEELWRGELHQELEQLELLLQQQAQVQKKLDQIARQNPQVQQLMQVPGVGVRTAEAVVAAIDVPERFRRGREVACYFGLTPRKYQSGKMDRDGHISRAGNTLIRKLLNQAAWSGTRSCPRMRQIYEQVKRKSPKRSKIAIVAVSRHLIVWLWAMLRDGRPFQATAARAA